MIGLGSSGSSPSGLEALTSLLALVTQPEEARAYLAEIAKAQLELEKKRTESQDAVGALKVEYDELKVRMARELDEHNGKLASDREKFDRLCRDGTDEIRRLKEGAAAERQIVSADRQAAAELKAKFEAKIKMIDGAASL